MPDNTLTHSRLSTLRQCPRKHYLRYERGLVRERGDDTEPLRIGSAFHRCMEYHTTGRPWADALDNYPAEYAVEAATVRALVAAHIWRYSESDITLIASEQSFRLPLYNPFTNRKSRTFVVAGKIDGIVRLPDGSVAVLEYKTVAEDIGVDSMYWRRLRGDAQISIYMLAAIALGYNPSTVLYDVTRRPSIRPKQIPTLDEHGEPVVLDAGGERVYTRTGTPRRTGDANLGYVLQCRDESPEEYGARVLEDCYNRPDFYFARREVPRPMDELREAHYELWQQAAQIADMRKADRWYRNVTRMGCQSCQYADLCLSNVNIDGTPIGYAVTENVHPELEAETDD